MLIWKEIKNKEDALWILSELKEQKIKAYYLEWLGRVVFSPRDTRINITTDGELSEGLGPAMARKWGQDLAQVLDIETNAQFKKIWRNL